MHISRKTTQNHSLGICWETSNGGRRRGSQSPAKKASILAAQSLPAGGQGYENKAEEGGLRGDNIRNPWSGQAWNRTRGKPGNSFDGVINPGQKTALADARIQGQNDTTGFALG